MPGMAELRGFLGRCSPRTRAVREAEARGEPETAVAAEPVAAVEPPSEVEPEPEIEVEIDPADLPPIESIKSSLDVQAFLQRGVPKALRQAALRRLWAVDPKISTFREVADYDWDFNAPGYGALLPGDDPKAAAARLVQALHRQAAELAPDRATEPDRSRDAQAVVDPASGPTASRPPADAVAAAEPMVVLAAEDGPPEECEPAGQPRRRRHGGAAPR